MGLKRGGPIGSLQSTTKVSKDGSNGFNIASNLGGIVPPSMLGLDEHGKQGFQSVANRTETLRRLSNIVNDGVDKEVFVTFATQRGQLQPLLCGKEKCDDQMTKEQLELQTWE